MPAMLYIIAGAASFIVACFYDWLSLKNLPVIKHLAWLLAAALNIYATIMVCISPVKYDVPLAVLILGACILPLSLFLLVLSLFIEIPFHSTYVKKGVGSRLITTGTYALTRHPGVLWLAFLYLSLAMLFPSTTLFIAVSVWIILDVLYVTVQDRILFVRMFPDYTSYQRRTPFLIPTRRSISECIKTIFHKDRTKV